MATTSQNGRPQTAPRADSYAAHSPAKALDSVAGGGLLVSSLIAGAGFAVLLAALTVGPYFLAGQTQPTQPKDTKPAAGAPAEPAAPPASPEPNTKAPTPGPTAGKAPGKDDIVSKLGENGTKTAPAKVNPLDKKDDDILKDIK